LPPDRIEHLEERVVRFTDLRAEELHDAQKSAGAHNGKAERAVKPINCRARGSGKVRVPYDVDDPRGPSGAPDASRKAHAIRERHATTLIGEWLSCLGRRHPRVCALQHTCCSASKLQ